MTFAWNNFSAEQIEQRQLCIGGSDAGKIMSGDDAVWYQLWAEKVGKAQPDDLSKKIPVQIGRATEALNLAWFERDTNHVIVDQQRSVVHPLVPYMRATLDGAIEGLDAVIDAKHVNDWDGRKITDLLLHYTPQLTHNALCAGRQNGIISAFFGTKSWDWGMIEIDPFYASALEERCAEFWRYVTEDKEPPGAPPAIEPPVPPEKMRTISMEGNNAWADAAYLWTLHAPAVKLLDGAVKTIKSMVDKDVGLATGHGIKVVRDGRGISIKEDKQ